MNSIFHRISTRKYESTPVTDAQIEQLLRAGMAAPSASNQQPWEFYVVKNPDLIAQLAKVSPYTGPCTTAPLVLVPCYRAEGLRSPMYAEIDLSACTQNILLEADSLGLGTCWMGIAPKEERMDAVQDILQIPRTLKAFCLISVGTPAEFRPQQDRFETSRIHYLN